MVTDEEGLSKRCPICEALPGWKHTEWCDMNYTAPSAAKWRVHWSENQCADFREEAQARRLAEQLVTLLYNVTVEELK